MNNVTLVQLDIVWENKAANFDRVRSLLSDSPPKPGSLIVLAEMFATGFSLNVAVTRDGEPARTEAFLAEVARQYQSTVVAGLVAVNASGQSQNESIAVAPSGKRIACYAKIHPFSKGGESACHTPGSEIVTFDWNGFTVAPFVCYDLRFPEIFRAAVRKGANLFVVIADWPAKRQQHWLTLLQARAIENLAYVVGVNQVGKDPQFTYAGRSVVVDPHGIILADAGETERVVQATIELETVTRWREEFPPLRDMHWSE